MHDHRRSAAALKLHGVCGRRRLRGAVVRDSTVHDYQTLIWRRLTPELSRADLRRRQSHNLSGSLPTPRSGVGLNELLDL